MQPFVFRLETLLKVRRMQEEQAQIEFAQATEAYREACDELARIQDSLDRHVEDWREKQQESVTVGTLKVFKDYYDKLIVNIKNQEMVVQAADQNRLDKLSALEAAARAKKLVEKLREKRLQQYQDEVIREEQKLLDELGMQAYSRRM